MYKIYVVTAHDAEHAEGIVVYFWDCWAFLTAPAGPASELFFTRTLAILQAVYRIESYHLLVPSIHDIAQARTEFPEATESLELAIL